MLNILMSFTLQIAMIMGFPSGSRGEESACHADDLILIPQSGRSPGEGNGYPLLIFLPGESCGQRGLAGYTAHGVTASDMSEAT